MHQAEYSGINAFLRDSCRLLLNKGVQRKTRDKICYELPGPYIFKILDPTARVVTIPIRKWYAPLAYGESLWLATGRNDMDFINQYGSNMKTFSDDGVTMRGGYGPRLRHYDGNNTDYDIRCMRPETLLEVDQFRYVVECFKKDINTRQAIINIGDPIKDCFGNNRSLKISKDIPCTRMLHFMKDACSNKLNLIVTMRSNDLIWGASAVNIFNFTFMQEYFAAILGLEVGTYYHIANNMHYYKDKRELVEEIAAVENVTDMHFEYKKSFKSLESFDVLLKELLQEEMRMRKEINSYQYHIFNDDFFQDWYNVLFCKLTKRNVEFINPILNNVIESGSFTKRL